MLFTLVIVALIVSHPVIAIIAGLIITVIMNASDIYGEITKN